MAFGYIDSHYINFAEGQTESRLRNGKTRLGIDFSQFIDRVSGALTAVNTSQDSLVTALTYRSNKDRIEGPFGADKIFQRSAEYTINRPQRGAGFGWLLPLFENSITLGFTKKALEVMSLDTFEGELSTTVQAVQRGQRADVLERLFSIAEMPLDNDGIGASPGFAGSGTGSNTYKGARPPGVTTLTMYQRVAVAGLEAGIANAMASLNFFYPGQTFELLTTATLIDDVTALTGFVLAGSPLVRPAQGVAEALVDATRYLGVLNGNILVRQPEGQLSGDTLAIYRSFGANNVLNPLVWRYSDIWGPNAWVEDRVLYPLADAEVHQNFGIGVSNPVGAALISVAGTGTYTPPAVLR